MPQTVARTTTPTWLAARQTAFDLMGPLDAVTVELHEAVGAVLAEPLLARGDLPGFRTAAMDGWAVAGVGPWRLLEGDLLAGQAEEPLPPASARVIATGAALPSTATGVLRREDGVVVNGELHGQLRDGLDFLPRGGECSAGELLLPAGVVLSPPAIGLAAASGHDTLAIIRPPRVTTLVLGDELLDHGTPTRGHLRDSLGPQLPAWIRLLNGVAGDIVRVPDTLGATTAALGRAAEAADVIITTGGTASGPVDHIHAALRALDATVIVDGVHVRPGYPMLLARLPCGTALVGLPGNPLSACVGALTLLGPLLAGLAGRSLPSLGSAVLTVPMTANREDTRLVPVSLSRTLPQRSTPPAATPVSHTGSAMLRGIAGADGLIAVPPGGSGAGETVALVAFPWTGAP